MRRFKPSHGFIQENPDHTLLRFMPYMAKLRQKTMSYCRYGRPFRKATVLFMPKNIDLKLLDCNHQGPHAVKLGGNYNGQRRWSKKHLKGAVPAPLIRSIVRQLHKQWGFTPPNVQPRSKYGARIGRAFVKVLPDTGATKAHCTTDTLTEIFKFNKGHNPPAMVVRGVPAYKVELADGTTVTGNSEAVADVHLITPSGNAMLTQVNFNIVPGKIAPIILGRSTLRKLHIPPIWDLIEKQITNAKKSPAMAKSAETVVLEEWRKRRKLQSDGEPETLVGIDDLYGLGAPEPTKSDLEKARDDILHRARAAGAPKDYMIFLTDLV